VRFCPQCGASVVAGARFCVECGENLAAPNLTAGAPGPAPVPPTGPQVAPTPPAPAAPAAGGLVPFVAIFGGLLAIGVVVTLLIMRQTPVKSGPAATAPATAQTAGGENRAGLPPGHPKVQLPKEALDFIKKIEAKAKADPKDLAAWDQLGDVTLRASAFDPSYYKQASEAYAHVLKADPNNLDALRGIGNIDFDQRKFDEAIAAYEHYLTKKPDDPDVRTDLGTMYLSTNNADQAVVQYKKVLAKHPEFFEAAFNMAVAYGQMNRTEDARKALDLALKIAPDADSRNRVNQMMASLSKMPPSGPESAAAGGMSASAAPPNVTVANPNTFKGAMEQMIRDLPVAGPKVQSLQWVSPTKTRVLMDNFPMDQMPPFASQKFMTDLKAGIDRVKTAHKISGPVEVDLCDAASGRVMKAVTE
jgi:tetratricopeptide (TPR) repeat protein